MANVILVDGGGIANHLELRDGMENPKVATTALGLWIEKLEEKLEGGQGYIVVVRMRGSERGKILQIEKWLATLTENSTVNVVGLSTLEEEAIGNAGRTYGVLRGLAIVIRKLLASSGVLEATHECESYGAASAMAQAVKTRGVVAGRRRPTQT